MTVWHLQHHHAGDDMLEVPLGWTFGAVVSDCDMISKIRARLPVRNRLSIPRYYLTDGRGVRVRAGSGRPKTVSRQPPTPPMTPPYPTTYPRRPVRGQGAARGGRDRPHGLAVSVLNNHRYI